MKMEAPDLKKIPTTTTRFGITLHDDYAWLRDKKNKEVMAYLEAENAFTKQEMAHTEAFQKELYKEMQSIQSCPDHRPKDNQSI